MKTIISTNLKSSEILLFKGHLLNPLDVCFNTDLVGSCSMEFGKVRLYKAICLTIEDNIENPDENYEQCVLPIETLREIALSCDTLYTNFGFDVHSHTLKTDKDLNHLKIERLN